jgi:hypothetical protein
MCVQNAFSDLPNRVPSVTLLSQLFCVLRMGVLFPGSENDGCQTGAYNQ